LEVLSADFFNGRYQPKFFDDIFRFVSNQPRIWISPELLATDLRRSRLIWLMASSAGNMALSGF
jgi:hypothetical protein